MKQLICDNCEETVKDCFVCGDNANPNKPIYCADNKHFCCAYCYMQYAQIKELVRRTHLKGE